jgi:predicted flap endonuclease-1-like 5' DNA nuclease
MDIDVLLPKLAKPAQRAIQSVGITTMEQLAKYHEDEIQDLHGIGKNAMDIIRATLKEYGLALAEKSKI